jgi:hypothetical protein
LLGASSVKPHAALRRAEGAGLDGEDVSRASIDVAVKRGMTGQCPKDRVQFLHFPWAHGKLPGSL